MRGVKRKKRRTCRHCGEQLGTGEYVEIRVLDWKPTEVTIGENASYTRWNSKSLMTEYICRACADVAVKKIQEERA